MPVVRVAVTSKQEERMLFAWLVFGLAGAVLLGLRAVANGYLLVMYSRRYGLIVLEHGSDERYHVLAPGRLPLALMRYLVLYVAYSLLVLRRRMQAWGHARKTLPLTAKA
jgi:hypothetical protein